jgi:hypothetical protein
MSKGLKSKSPKKPVRKLMALRDRSDDRDVLYKPVITSVPRSITIEDVKKRGIPVLDQGEEGACTGFALATVIHESMRRTWGTVDQISPWMLYHNAQKYDEWAGESYEGSSCRGALKAWQKNGVLPLKDWGKSRVKDVSLEEKQASFEFPCGLYARATTRKIRELHIAIAMNGAIYCSGDVHSGWDNVNKKTGIIEENHKINGGHAFALVGYTELGFVVQNSWGEDWGKDGFAILKYEDFLRTICDAWVVGLGAPCGVFS